MKLRVAVLYGGRSGEHEVSLRSAASVFMRLDRDRYTVIPVAMDKQGCFHLHDDASLYAAAPEVLPVTSSHSTPLSAILVDGRFALDVDVVFPVVHGPLYEDGALQGLLELAGVAYVGCQVLSSALGMDKDLQRRLVCIDGLACTDYRVIPAQVTSEQLPELFSRLESDTKLRIRAILRIMHRRKLPEELRARLLGETMGSPLRLLQYYSKDLK
jgi:D-alanine-D-alanine ligase